jgi:hypothetical protein
MYTRYCVLYSPGWENGPLLSHGLYHMGWFEFRFSFMILFLVVLADLLDFTYFVCLLTVLICLYYCPIRSCLVTWLLTPAWQLLLSSLVREKLNTKRNPNICLIDCNINVINWLIASNIISKLVCWMACWCYAVTSPCAICDLWTSPALKLVGWRRTPNWPTLPRWEMSHLLQKIYNNRNIIGIIYPNS